MLSRAIGRGGGGKSRPEFANCAEAVCHPSAQVIVRMSCYRPDLKQSSLAAICRQYDTPT